MPRDSSKNAEEAGPRATDDANHRGGGEGGAADLHAGAADGDASMQRAQPSGDGALATGDTGGQVSPAPQTAATLQQLALGGDTEPQWTPEQMLFALGWNSANQQQQQQQQGRAGEREEALPRPVMSAAQNLGDLPHGGATGVGPPPHQQFMSPEQIRVMGQEQEAYAQQQHMYEQQQRFAQQQQWLVQRGGYGPPPPQQQQQQQQQQWREDFTQQQQQQQQQPRREDFAQHHQHPYHGQPSGGGTRGVSFPGLPPDARGVAPQDGEMARMQAALTAANERAAAADAENASLRARDAASEVGSEYGSVAKKNETRCGAFYSRSGAEGSCRGCLLPPSTSLPPSAPSGWPNPARVQRSAAPLHRPRMPQPGSHHRGAGAALLGALLLLLSPTPASAADLCQPDGLRNGSSTRREFTVGALAIRGIPAAFAEFNSTFDEYLTATAGKKFRENIRFRLVPLNFISLFSEVEAGRLDFIFVNPSAYSCIESEFGANSLVSMINKRTVGGSAFLLSQFGGVIFARANRADINVIMDLKGKRVAAASISGLGSGQMQFRTMQQAGMSYIHDPSQVVFTSNQGKVVNGVLSGAFDVGFVRTDQIERTKNSSGVLVDPKLFKIIQPVPGLEDTPGYPFPFKSSTILYPEWNVGAVGNNVPEDVQEEVQFALLQLEEFANRANVSRLDPPAGIEEVARVARQKGSFQGWRPTISYMELRNMQEETGFIQRGADNKMRCIRSAELIDAIVCPPNHFRKSDQEILDGCRDAGLACATGYQCVCRPCQKGYEENIRPTSLLQNTTDLSSNPGCPKMSVCGRTQQRERISFEIVDNLKRGVVNFSFIAHLSQGQQIAGVAMKNLSDTLANGYTFDFESSLVGIHLIQMQADGVELSESPLRVLVEPRFCELDFGEGSFRVADEKGECVCETNTVIIAAVCVRLVVLLPSLLIPLFLIAVGGIIVYIRYQRRLADSVWAVRPDELNFSDPVEIIGRGTFGLVLKAEYRGTVVAVKRVIPAKSEPVTSVTGAIGFLRGTSKAKDPSASIKSNQTKSRWSAMGAESGSGGVNANHFQQIKESFQGTGSGDRPVDTSFKTETGSWTDLDDLDYIGNGIATGGGKRDLSTMSAAMARGSIASFANPAQNFNSFSVAGTDSMSSTPSGIMSGLFTNTSQGFSNDNSKTKKLNHNQLRAQFIEEMRTLSKLRHPCITTVMGAVIESGSEPMLIMEFMEHGSLYDMLHNNTIVVEGEIVLPILRDVAQGLRFLHAATPVVVHGDLKAQNVLVDSKFRAKVADFGLTQKRVVGATGTPFWMAPELFLGGVNTPSSDVYAFGIVLYEVYSRSEPYEGEDPEQVLRQVVDENIQKRPEVPPACPPEVVSLMQDCQLADPAGRPPFDEIDRRMKMLSVSHASPLEINFSLQKSKDLRAKQAEDVLFDVFPKHVAEALRDGKKVEAEAKECVTIFFSDIKGFTTIAATLDAVKVSHMLDRLYSKFDMLTQKHEVFKVETIGDAYMAVTNLVSDQPDDHAARMARFSMEAVTAARETLIDEDDPLRGTVSIRVGFHSGPVVANVVGTRAPRYCLFGDTVNTASRMESNSQEHSILCSSRAAHLVHKQAPDLKLTCRGIINVKGKGDMKVYWVGTPAQLQPRMLVTLGTLHEIEAPASEKQRASLDPLCSLEGSPKSRGGVGFPLLIPAMARLMPSGDRPSSTGSLKAPNSPHLTASAAGSFYEDGGSGVASREASAHGAADLDRHLAITELHPVSEVPNDAANPPVGGAATSPPLPGASARKGSEREMTPGGGGHTYPVARPPTVPAAAALPASSLPPSLPSSMAPPALLELQDSDDDAAVGDS